MFLLKTKYPVCQTNQQSDNHLSVRQFGRRQVIFAVTLQEVEEVGGLVQSVKITDTADSDGTEITDGNDSLTPTPPRL